MRFATPQHHMESRRQPDNIPPPGDPSLYLPHTIAPSVGGSKCRVNLDKPTLKADRGGGCEGLGPIGKLSSHQETIPVTHDPEI